MPELEKEREEAYAQGIASGLSVRRAGAKAGYKANSHTWIKKKLETDKFKTRLDELERAAIAENPGVAILLDRVLILSQKARKLDSPAGLAAAGRLLLVAARLKTRQAEQPDPAPTDDEMEMSAAEWVARYGPKS